MHDLQGWSHVMLSHVFSKFIAWIQICQLRRSPCFAKWRSNRRSWTLRSTWLTKLGPWKHGWHADIPSVARPWDPLDPYFPSNPYFSCFWKRDFHSFTFHFFPYFHWVSEFKGCTRQIFSRSCLIWSGNVLNVLGPEVPEPHLCREHRS